MEKGCSGFAFRMYFRTIVKKMEKKNHTTKRAPHHARSQQCVRDLTPAAVSTENYLWIRKGSSRTPRINPLKLPIVHIYYHLLHLDNEHRVSKPDRPKTLPRMSHVSNSDLEFLEVVSRSSNRDCKIPRIRSGVDCGGQGDKVIREKKYR